MSNGQMSGMLLTIRQGARQSSTAKNYPARNISGTMVENPELL